MHTQQICVPQQPHLMWLHPSFFSIAALHPGQSLMPSLFFASSNSRWPTEARECA